MGRAELAALAHPEATAGGGPVVAALVAPADTGTDAGGEGERFALVLRGGAGGGCAEVYASSNLLAEAEAGPEAADSAFTWLVGRLPLPPLEPESQSDLQLPEHRRRREAAGEDDGEASPPREVWATGSSEGHLAGAAPGRLTAADLGVLERRVAHFAERAAATEAELRALAARCKTLDAEGQSGPTAGRVRALNADARAAFGGLRRLRLQTFGVLDRPA